MANLKTMLCGIELDTPFVLGSGPAGWDAVSLAACAKAGAGAVVTKSIAIKGFINHSRHMVYNGTDSLLNNEGGSDLPLKQWTDYEIPKAKDLGVKTLIASVYGYGPLEEVLEVSAACERAGADLLELMSGYEEPGSLLEYIPAIKQAVKLPVLAKVNGNWKNTADVAYECIQAGANGVTAIDSIGPVYRVNIATGRPLLGGNAYGYLTGTPIFPLSLRFVHDIAEKGVSELVGLGGISSAEAAIEMLMAGASACGVCSAAILRGPKIFTELSDKLARLMDGYGYPDIPSISGEALRSEKLPDRTPANFLFHEEACTHCNRCVTACAYHARNFVNGKPVVDETACRMCGLCVGVCNAGAITIA